ncbi:hypothetical protein PhaeoP88_04055 (plasmid) [Phaeobacter inhibens]|uniref:Uncharacterized protein n=1 Tax=Phaeobacter inhibens TaxID=221822 RepID=A0A2I7KFJ8_9RHOB|nr:hypothetical protein PhaeoP88_04055 [Phaeobacter inhibens]
MISQYIKNRKVKGSCTWIVSIRLFSLIVMLSMFSFPISSQSSTEYSATNRIKIVPELYIDAESQADTIMAMIKTFNALIASSSSSLPTSKSGGNINFYFASGREYLKNNRVSKSAFSASMISFYKPISQLETNSDTCYVQPFQSNTGWILLSVHNEDNDYSEDIYRCFVAALWWYSYATLEGLDTVDWRNSLVNILKGVK